MELWLSAEFLSTQMSRILQWAESELFVWATLLQVGALTLAAAAAWALAKVYRRVLAPMLDRWRFMSGIGAVQVGAHVVIWMLLSWMLVRAASAADLPEALLRLTATLLTAWVIIRFASSMLHNRLAARLVAVGAWTLAALSVLEWLDPVIEVLDSAAFEIGDVRLSAYSALKSVFVLAFLLWLATAVSNVVESRLRVTSDLSPSIQVLLAKSLRILLLVVAFLVALRAVGIELTALTVFGGAIGLGLGFGLQQIVANYVSGMILLSDRSIKPGDVIAVGSTYGWVRNMAGRYISVVTRDGVEHLIPNETFITQPVENWTHSDQNVRLKIDVGVHYSSDVRQAMALCVEAAQVVTRVLARPGPVCQLKEFGESSVDLELRIWINDPQNGISNVRSDVRLEIWDRFKAHGIEIPYPQRDLNLRQTESLNSLSRRFGAN